METADNDNLRTSCPLSYLLKSSNELFLFSQPFFVRGKYFSLLAGSVCGGV